MSNVNYISNSIIVTNKKNEIKINNVKNQINVNFMKKNYEIRNTKNQIKVDVIGRVYYNNVSVNYIPIPPENRNSPGQVGQLASDDDAVYFCFARDQWAFWRLIKGW